MKRSVLFLTALSFAGLAACFPPTPAPASAYVQGKNGYDAGNGGPTAIVGTISTLSTSNTLPTAYPVSSAALLDAGSPDPSVLPYLNELVSLNDTIQYNGAPPSCPQQLQYQGCNGFNAINAAATASLWIDTYLYAASSNYCGVDTVFNTTYATTVGVFQDEYYSSASPMDLFTLVLPDCSGLGSTLTYGGTNTPTASTDIQSLLTTNKFINGNQVTVRGVVVGVGGTNASFTAAIEDPGGGANAGLLVRKKSSSKSAATKPSLGDYISVTGGATVQSPYSKIIDL